MEKQPWYKIRVDLRFVGGFFLFIIWLILLSSLLYDHFYWAKFPWFVTTFYPPISSMPGGIFWWTSRWVRVYGTITFLEQGLFAYFLYKLSKVFKWFKPVVRNILFFGLAVSLGVYAGYMDFLWYGLYGQGAVWDIVFPMIQILTASIAILLIQHLFLKLRKHFSIRNPS